MNLVKEQPQTRHNATSPTVYVYKYQDAVNLRMLEQKERRMYDGRFIGACIENGAQKSACGLAEAQDYAKDNPGSLKKGIHSLKSKFGQKRVQRMRLITIKIPLEDYSHSKFKIHAVNLDMPLIIGLDILKYNALLVNYIYKRLEYRNLDYRRPLTYNSEHAFLE